MLLSFLLNLVRLGTKSVWLDESTSVLYGRLSFATLLPVLAGGDPNMGLYHLLLNLWVRAFGESEVAVRSMSALFGAFAVASVYLLGVRLFGRTAGLVAGLLFALDAFVVKYAQTARSYALLVLLVSLSSYFLVIELDRPTRPNRIAYAITSTLAVYAHYFAAYVLVVHFATVLVMRRRGALKREWLEVSAAILLLCLPEVIIAYHSGAGWIGWIKQPSVNDLWAVLVALAGGSRLLLIALLVCGFWATVCAVRERRYWPQGFVTAWLVVPIALSFTASFVQPMFLDRYLIICVPALVLFGASAIAELRRPVATGMLVALLVWLSATRLAVYYGRDGLENWRDATRSVLNDMRPSDAIVFYPPYAQRPFEYYQRQAEVSQPPRALAPAPVDQQRVWLVIRESDTADHFFAVQRLQASLTKKYRPAGEWRFSGVELQLYVPNIRIR